MKGSNTGSITVFLSLILLLVLATILTTVEGARVSAASALSLRALMTGLNSVMAGYYTPLYEEYHVFGLDASYNTSEINHEKIIETLNDYMEYTFQPDKNLKENDINNGYLKLYGVQNILENNRYSNMQNLYGVNIENTVIDKVTSLLDYKGELFKKQALEYMKYKVPVNTVESFWETTSLMGDTKESVEILEEKEKTEAKVQQLDEVILKLMEKLDGITISKKGIKMKSNQIVVEEFFVKKFQEGPVSMDKTGIHNNWLFGALKNHYSDITNDMKLVINQVDHLSDIDRNLQSLQYNSNTLLQIDTSQMTKEEKKEFKKNLESANKQLKNLEHEKSNVLSEIISNVKIAKQQIDGVLKVTSDAILILDQGESIQQDITGEIEAYEELVKSSKETLGAEFYESLLEGVEIISKYKGSHSDEESEGMEALIDSKYDFSSMKQQLIENQVILNQVSNNLSMALSTTADSISKLRGVLSNAQMQMNQYNTNTIKFDYSTLVQAKDSEPFLNEIKNLIEKGIVDLVVEDYNTISQKELDTESLPTDLVDTDASVLTDVKGLLDNIDLEKGSNLLKDLLIGNHDQTIADIGEEQLNSILYQEYLYDHFGDYTKDKDGEDKVLNYELEYILKGNSKDVDNLSSVVMQLLSTRTILNVITLLSDGTKTNEAKLLAASFVGFTGMPLLVEAVKMLILSLWALVESLVDIAALLRKKAIPIIKTGKDIQVKLTEIMGINKTFLQNKANHYKEIKTPLTLKYNDYIGLFLFFQYQDKKLYRTMDLIQENLQFNYSEMFYMKNCLTGLRVTGTFHMNPKFVSIPFVKSYIKEDIGGYQYIFTREYTY